MRQVCYLYNPDFTKFVLSEEHPMKPMRLKMVHSLINNYNLTSQLNMFYSKAATPEELCLFHHPQYVKYLETWVTPNSSHLVNTYDIRAE
jgi:acetoin utilization deacetylase AcuC-like enzyme